MPVMLGRPERRLSCTTGVSDLYPNKPSGYTSSNTLDFTQAVPSGGPTATDKPIVGASPWTVIGHIDPFSTYWVAGTEEWIGTWPAGTYATGHGIGDIGMEVPGDPGHVYFSIRFLMEFSGGVSDFHAVSNKFVQLDCQGGSGGVGSILLVQLREQTYWRRTEYLPASGSAFGIDTSGDVGTIAGMVSNIECPTNQEVHIEVLVDLAAGRMQIWQDGTLTTSTTSCPYLNTEINAVSIKGHRGGGGETLGHDLKQHYTNFHVAW